ncbi:MAG: GNAT family N-acetyltransferase [Polyangiaceae bacterium]
MMFDAGVEATLLFMSSPLRVSQATSADYAACARLFAELEVPEPPWSAERFSETVVPDAIVLRADDAVVAYGWARQRGDVFHVMHVAVDPLHRGRGAGRLVMTTLAARARALGLSRWMLNTKPTNLVARALYEQFGMSVAFESSSVQLAWSDVERLEIAAGVHAREIGPSEDGAFEQARGLGVGEIDSFRKMGRIVFGAEDEHGPVAFGAFDRDYPGVSPMRVKAPRFVRILLDAVRPHVREGQSYVRISVEGDPALEDALTQAGGKVVLRVLRMHGDVPSPG